MSKTILWIEDEPSTIDGPRAVLEFGGTEVFVAETADAARRALARSPVDIILVDQWLRPPDGDPRVTGAELIAALRAGELGNLNIETPFVFVTAHEGWIDAQAASAHGGFLGTIGKAGDVSGELAETLDRLFVIHGLVGPDGRPLRAGTPGHKRLVVTFKTISDRVLTALGTHPELMHGMHWRDFEIMTAEMWKRHGWDVELTPPGNDGGVDIYAARNAEAGRLLYAIDCKRYKPERPIGPALVRQLRGVAARDGADCGVLMTTSSFTKGAQVEHERGPIRLSLHDLDDIALHLTGKPLT